MGEGATRLLEWRLHNFDREVWLHLQKIRSAPVFSLRAHSQRQQLQRQHWQPGFLCSLSLVFCCRMSNNFTTVVVDVMPYSHSFVTYSLCDTSFDSIIFGLFPMRLRIFSFCEGVRNVFQRLLSALWSSRYYFLSNPSTVCYFFLIFRVLRVQSRSAEKAIIVFDSHRCDTFFQYQILHHCDDRNMTSGPVMPAFLFSSPLRELSLQEIEEPVLVARHKRLFIFQKVPPSPTTLCAH